MRSVLVGGAIVLCVLVGGCGSGTTTQTTRASTQARREHSARRVRHHHFPRYAGIGATIGDFTHDNTMFCLNCSLSTGEAAYTITGRRDGRVTAYKVAEAFRPAASAATRLSLVTGTMIPGPATEPVRRSANCLDYRVPMLKRLVGVEYTEASTTPGSTMATMQAVAAPACP